MKEYSYSHDHSGCPTEALMRTNSSIIHQSESNLRKFNNHRQSSTTIIKICLILCCLPAVVFIVVMPAARQSLQGTSYHHLVLNPAAGRSTSTRCLFDQPPKNHYMVSQQTSYNSTSANTAWPSTNQHEWNTSGRHLAWKQLRSGWAVTWDSGEPEVLTIQNMHL